MKFNLKMAKARFLPANRDLEILGEPSVLALALKHKIEIEHSCGGSGSCGTCHVFVTCTKENLAERNDVEAAMALDRGFKADERLACQIDPVDGLVIRVPDYFDDL